MVVRTTAEIDIYTRLIVSILSLPPPTFQLQLLLLAKQLTDILQHIFMRSQCITFLGKVDELL